MRVVLYYTLSTEILLYRVLTVLLFLFFCLLRPLSLLSFFFFFNDTATTEIYTLSLHDALPISFNLDNQIGGGGRLGYFFGEHVGVEVDAGYQAPSAKTGPASAKLSFGSASLVLSFGNESNLFYLLGGYSRLDFEDSAPYRFTDNAIHGALGDRIFLSSRVALRLEVRGIYAPSTKASFGPDWAGHVGGTLGLSAVLGGEARDLDGDGVADRKDACPGTPTGAIVDTRGCPTDADGDGIYNGLDACPNTPMGAHVDARGCPTDADADGVYDGIDQCPGTPANAKVDATGCPTDAVLDGVAAAVESD